MTSFQMFSIAVDVAIIILDMAIITIIIREWRE